MDNVLRVGVVEEDEDGEDKTDHLQHYLLDAGESVRAAESAHCTKV